MYHRLSQQTKLNEEKRKRESEKSKEELEKKESVNRRRIRNKVEKERLEKWRKEYEENQKKDIIRKRQEEIAKRNEEERIRIEKTRELEKKNDVESLQRRNVYFQARQEAELNKMKHIEAERKAANNIFGYVEPEPPAKQRPSTAASAKKADVSGDLNNNQLNKQNYHYVNKAYNYNSPSSQVSSSAMQNQPESSIPNSYLIQKSKPETPNRARNEAPASYNQDAFSAPKQETPSYSRSDIPKSSKPENVNRQRKDLASAQGQSSKPPSFEDFFPPAKKADKRAPVNPPKPIYKPTPLQKDSVGELIQQPKKQLQNVYQNIVEPELKYQGKYGNQREELNELKSLIDGATDFAFLEDSLKQQNFGDSSEYDEVYG